jgi:hypothetical protein
VNNQVYVKGFNLSFIQDKDRNMPYALCIPCIGKHGMNILSLSVGKAVSHDKARTARLSSGSSFKSWIFCGTQTSGSIIPWLEDRESSSAMLYYRYFITFHTQVQITSQSLHSETCSKWPLSFLTKAAYRPADNDTAAKLTQTGIINSSGSAKTIVETNESISNEFCMAASVDENSLRSFSGAPFACQSRWKYGIANNLPLGRYPAPPNQRPTGPIYSG